MTKAKLIRAICSFALGSFALLSVLCPNVVQGQVEGGFTVGLAVDNVSVSDITRTSAVISWRTSVNATSQVFYDTAYHDDIADYADNTTEDTTLVIQHSVPLTGLSPSVTYHYRVKSVAVVNATESIAISEDYTFTTLRRPGGGGGGGGGAVYYLETNLLGTEESFHISGTGEIPETIEASSADGVLAITIPEGTIALDKDGKRLRSIQAVVDESPPDPPEDTCIIGPAYDFQPDGATFDPPIALACRYDPALIPEGVAEQDLVVAYYDEDSSQWIELDCIVDTPNNTIIASVGYFTTFAIIGTIMPPPPPPPPPVPAIFSVTELSIKPMLVEPNEIVTIAVSVANTGGSEGSYRVVLKINGVEEAEKSATIAAGSSEVVTFSVIREESGSYNVAVDSLSASFAVVAPAPPVKPSVIWPVFGGLIAAGLVVGLLIYFFLVRRYLRW